MSNLSKPVRVAVYCYSEVEDSDFIGYQRYVVQRELAERMDRAPVVTHYADDGVCGWTEARPNFQRLLLDVAAGIIDCVAVIDRRRLALDPDGEAQLSRLFQRHGVLLVECRHSTGAPARAAA